MAKKPSFFDKLTGHTEEFITEEEVASPAIAKKIKSIKPTFDEPSVIMEGKKDWPPEAEGQLVVDVYQGASEIVIKSTVAGVKPEDLDITITNDMVTIKGKREKDEEIKTENYFYQECYWGSFSRSIILPEDIDAEKAEAALKNGILTIRLPKLEKTKTKKLQVKTV